jgi:hypothetical protein
MTTFYFFLIMFVLPLLIIALAFYLAKERADDNE